MRFESSEKTGALVVALVLVTALIPAAAAQSSDRPQLMDDSGNLITEGLVLAGWDYFQSGWQADPIELRLARDTWAPPRSGDDVDSLRTWQSATADSAGWISHPDLRGGYLFAVVDSEEESVVVLEGLGHRAVTVNGIPRSGNLYGFKDTWESWEPPFDFSFVPMKLQRGTNQFLFGGGRAPRMKLILHRPDTPFILNTRDITVPDLIVGEEANYWASVTLINATESTANGMALVAATGDASAATTAIAAMPPLSVRKVAFQIVHPAPAETGSVDVRLAVVQSETGEEVDVDTITLAVKSPADNQRRTFVSSIDGSVQYYGLNPATETDAADSKALVLSVHGAAVEAINQSGSYRSKSWAHIVAPTNRRPFGFNWEDWGRVDALEVLDIAEQTLNVDPNRIYLTGHSMGGHGSWHLGALYPDRFAAVGPSAGWISFWSYRPRGELEMESPVRRMLMRATLPSRTMDLATNYADLGIYVIHGADDDNVPATQSRMMVERLSSFHRDFVYHEEPNAGHWWDKSDEDGADCVDWPPLFDFFARHALPDASEIRDVDFVTPNPGVSSCHRWACVLQQVRPLHMSRVSLRFDPGRRRFVGETENVEKLLLTVPENETDSVDLFIDGQQMRLAHPSGDLLLRRSEGVWGPHGESPVDDKGPHRNGTFKDAFRNRAVLVYGTLGSPVENAWALAKARFDSEHFWYQGNGGFDVVADTEFRPEDFADRNVVIYGNAQTNDAWVQLLGSSPVRVTSDRMEVGDRAVPGDDLGMLLIRPRPDSDVASVAAVGGTGITGMRITNSRPYLSAGFAYPDLVVFRADESSGAGDIVVGAGFFGNDWTVEKGEFVWEYKQ